MGFDCINYLPKGINPKELEEFLILLGFTKISKSYYFYYDQKNYTTLSGIDLTIDKDKNNILCIHQHSLAFCSNADLEKINKTAKYLSKFFGGKFHSDLGTRRYIPKEESGIDLKGAEGGCYIAYSNFQQNMKRLELYTGSAEFKISTIKLGIPQLDSMNPEIVSSHLVIPFLVSIIEDYFKSCYIALLKGLPNEKKESLYKSHKIYPDDLIKVGNIEMSLEEAITKGMTFQNIDKIINHFKELDDKLKLDSFLKRPYRNRNQDHYLFLSKIFNQRHEIIHHHRIIPSYTKIEVLLDIRHSKTIFKRIHNYLITKYKWNKYNTLYP
ncbi:MAG: hypothetical protein ISS16_06660 [Ignavibacteria bacterium]|nr:hypothetical protein [Ignavibacteria bacterium]